MHNATVGATLRLAVEMLVLLAVVQFVLLPTLTERFRQRMFEIRRRLFVFMANGGIRPDDIAYVRLRSTTNSMLRYAERVWLVEALVMAVVFRREVAAHQARVMADLASADGGRARERILLFKREIDDAVADHLIATSFVAWVLVAWVLVAVATIVVTLRRVV
jgi:hypothetical protein